MGNVAIKLATGDLISAAFDQVKASSRPALLYVVVVTFLNSIAFYLIDTSPLIAAIIDLVAIVVAIYGDFLLLRHMLRVAGRLTEPGGFFSYFVTSIAVGFAVIAGLILLIVPGLIIAARCSLALPLVAGRSATLGEAFSESWQRTKGNEVPIIFATLAMVFLPFGIAYGVTEVLGEALQIGILLSELLSNSSSVLFAALSVVLLTALLPSASHSTSDIA
jgi:hypothetical protein